MNHREPKFDLYSNADDNEIRVKEGELKNEQQFCSREK